MHIQREDITGVILAGGAGIRAGRKDKGLLMWRDKPLIEHVLERIAPQTGPLLISCNRNAQIYRRYGPTIEDFRADFQGPLAGLESVENAISTPYILVSACDTPLLPADLVMRLQSCLLRHPDEQPSLAYACDGQRNHYLCALLHRDCLKTLGSFLDGGERAVHRWYAMQHAFVADFSDQPDCFSNLNTLHTA